MCRALHAERSGYYAYCEKLLQECARDIKKEFLEKIKRIFKDHYFFNGSPGITIELMKDGLKVNHKYIERLMIISGIKAKTRRKYKQTTNTKHDLPVVSI